MNKSHAQHRILIISYALETFSDGIFCTDLLSRSTNSFLLVIFRPITWLSSLKKTEEAMKKWTKLMVATMITFIPILGVCNVDAKESDCQKKESSSVELLITLPSEFNTPDGAALDSNGNIILSIPNFNNDPHQPVYTCCLLSWS